MKYSVSITAVITAVITFLLTFYIGSGPTQVENVQLEADSTLMVETANSNHLLKLDSLKEWSRRYDRVYRKQILRVAEKQQRAYKMGRESTRTDSLAVLWIARAVYSETRSFRDMELIAWVVYNRMQNPNYPSTAKKVVLEEKQFSAFNQSSDRRDYLMSVSPKTGNPYFNRAHRLAEYVLTAPQNNPVRGVNHFVMPETQRKLYGDMPDWYHKGTVHTKTKQTVFLSGVTSP